MHRGREHRRQTADGHASCCGARPIGQTARRSDGTNTTGRNWMRTIRMLAATAALATTMAVAGVAHAGKDLDAIKARGQLICGVGPSSAGFYLLGSDGKWSGIDVDVC